MRTWSQESHLFCLTLRQVFGPLHDVSPYMLLWLVFTDPYIQITKVMV